MEQDTIVKMNFFLALVMWSGALLIHITFQKIKKRVLNARNVEDMRQFHCVNAKKIAGLTSKFYKLFLIILIITSVVLITGTSLRLINLLNEHATSNVSLYDLLHRLVNLNIFFGWLFIFGAFTALKVLLGYSKILVQKCMALGLIEEK